MFKRTLLFVALLLGTPAFARTEVGRLLMLAFSGSAPPLEQLEAIGPSGFIFFPSNVPSTEAARDTTKALQNAADYPLLFGIDQEGGPFTSYRVDEATLFPGNMALGAAGEPDLARRVGEATGHELAYAGFNVNFAPAVDVMSNPDNPIIGIRSFGAVPARVGELGTAYLEGLSAAGVAGVAKHFPGHGDTGTDSHLGLPSVAGDRERLSRVELLPFKALIAAGVPAIMTAHVAFPAFQADVPATLSEPVLTGLLREELGFDGLVVTDSMDMKAVADRYGPGEAAVRSVLAGADLVLLGPDEGVQREVLGALQEAVESGRLSEARVAEAISRSEAVARRYRPRWDAPPPDYPAHRALALQVAMRGATLLRNNGVLPFPPDAEVVVVAPQPSGYGEPPHLGSVLKRHHANVRSVVVDEQPSQTQVAEAARKAARADAVVLGSYHWLGDYPPEFVQLATQLVATGTPLVVVALGNPDDLRFLPPRDAYLAVYGYREANLEAASAVLLGEAPRGRLPVPAGDHPVGAGETGF